MHIKTFLTDIRINFYAENNFRIPNITNFYDQNQDFDHLEHSEVLLVAHTRNISHKL